MSTVSVIMPCYNHGTFLEESIRGILNQRYAELKLIIIDDCSSDNSREIIEKYKRIDKRIYCISHERNMGASASRNQGIICSEGKYIGFCDADDIWTEDKLEIQIERLGNNPSYNIVYCDSEIIDEKGLPTGQRFSTIYNKTPKRSGNIFSQLCLGNFINMQTVLLKKECLNDSELFDVGIKWMEDWMFWITLAEKHHFLYIDKVLAKYRLHGQSTNLIHEKECVINRIKVRSQVLDRYPDIPFKEKSRILYEIGIAYDELGEKHRANMYFLRSLGIGKTNFRALYRLFFPKRRLVSINDTPKR